MISVDAVVDVVVPLVGGGGGAAPGEWIVPAITETASVMLRIATVHVRRKVFTFGCPPRKKEIQKLLHFGKYAKPFVFHPRTR